MPERFLVRTQDGPNPGTRVGEDWTWPLPELLLAEGGCYVKASESQLPPTGEDSNVLRGAEYRWQAGDATADQLTKAISVALKAHRVQEAHALLYPLALVDPQQAQAVRDAMLLGLKLAREIPGG